MCEGTLGRIRCYCREEEEEEEEEEEDEVRIFTTDKEEEEYLLQSVAATRRGQRAITQHWHGRDPSEEDEVLTTRLTTVLSLMSRFRRVRTEILLLLLRLKNHSKRGLFGRHERLIKT